MQAKFRLYSKGGNLVHRPFMFEDTLYWNRYGSDFPTRPEALKQSAVHTAANMVKMFIPYWQKQNRWYYSDNNAKMKEAAQFATSNNWRNAALVWGEEYEREKKNTRKARLASNISLANEMLDDIENALIWAQISYDLFYPNRNKESVKDDFFRISSIKLVLENRLKEFKRLDEQKGILPEEWEDEK